MNNLSYSDKRDEIYTHLGFIISICSKLEESEFRRWAILIKDQYADTIYSSKNVDEFAMTNRNFYDKVNEIIIAGKVTNEEFDGFSVEICEIPRPILSDKKLFLLIIRSNSMNEITFDIASKCYHDIQEPLRNVSNFLQLLSFRINESGNEEEKQYMSYAFDGVNRLRTWTSDFLSSSINWKKQNRKSIVSILDIVSGIKALLQYQISARRCIFNVDENVASVFGAKSEIFSLFKNLIENSLKHAVSQDELIICISENRNKSTSEMACIVYEDNGQVAGSKNSKNGIGLTMCSEIVRSNGGTLENIGGCGTQYRYEITLPKPLSSSVVHGETFVK